MCITLFDAARKVPLPCCGGGATLPGFDLRSKSTTYNQRLRHGTYRGKVFALVKRGASKSISYNQWIRA